MPEYLAPGVFVEEFPICGTNPDMRDESERYREGEHVERKQGEHESGGVRDAQPQKDGEPDACREQTCRQPKGECGTGYPSARIIEAHDASDHH